MKAYGVCNLTKNVQIASDVEVADSPWTRMRGLIGRKDLAPGKGLWIQPSEGVHTIGMAFPIDVVYLDRDHRVLKVYHSLPPFRIGAVSMKTRSVLELPAGTLSRTQTTVGDILEFQPVK